MTVPPNYGPPPEQPQTPGYGYQSPHSGGPSPYGSQPQYGQQPPYGQEPQYGGGQQPPYGQEPQYSGGGQQPPYGQDPGYGGPVLPPEPPKRNLALIGGIVVGVTVLVLGAALLITMNLRGEETDSASEGDTTSEAASDEATSEEAATSAEEDAGSEVGQCLPYESEISGDGFALVDCSDATAFWEITAQSYDVTDVAVDDEGYLVDRTAVDELCGAEWGLHKPGETWTNYDYVYSSGTLDSLYCVQATGNPDPAEPGHLPVVPDVGDCFDDSAEWWTVDCGSDLAMYETVDVITYDEPVQDMSDEQAETDAAACDGVSYWKVTDRDGRTSAILCTNNV